MRDDLADPVYAVFRSGLDLKERLERHPELLDFLKEQANLKEVVRKVPNLGEQRGGGDETFLGIRYPLVCWLDEIFILSSSWKTEWTESSLEQALYDSRDRAWKFWEQAELAESRVSADALEVFYLCVMLGFRGERRNQLDKLKSWQRSCKSLLFDSQVRRWTPPEEAQITTFVPPLKGAQRKQGMLLAWAASILILTPIVMFFLTQLFST